jgi:hypothetical protein
MKKMKIKFNIAVILFLCLAMYGCKKYDTDYKAFLDNREEIYPGLATGVGYHSGNLRAVLVWHPSPDPSIKNYVVSWNNGSDSVIVDATSHTPADSITVSIPNLKEYVYSFKITAHDNAGNTSVGQDLNNVKIYGPVYQSTLLNRAYNTANPYQLNDDGSVVLNFNKADTGNVSTTIKYTNKLGVASQKSFGPKDNSVTLTDYKLGTSIKYNSAYKPVADAADAFEALTDDDFPIIYNIVECDKSLFKAYNLPTDVPSAYGWETYYLWDKNTGEPGFHTPGQDFPIWFTFDMGQSASLAKMRVWQRTSGLYNYGNPKRFEIYGSNNPSSNGDYSNWVKLGSFTSVKPSGLPVGQNSQADADFAAAGEPFTFPAGLAPYRYIRFKVLETWGGTNYFHILELTMYKTDK